MLGKPAKHPALERLLKDNQLPYTVVPDGSRAAAAVKTRTGAVVSAEELVVRPLPPSLVLASASILCHLMRTRKPCLCSVPDSTL